MDEQDQTNFSIEDLRILESSLLKAVSNPKQESLPIHANYILQTSRFIVHLLSGYNALIAAKKTEALPVLARSMLEAIFRLEAIAHKPEYLFRIAHTEFESDRSWMRNSSISDAEKVIAVQTIDDQWEGFKLEYVKQYPSHLTEEKTIKLEHLAQSAKTSLGGVYNAQYRLYSRFTHVNLRASAGGLGGMDESERMTVGCCAEIALRSLRSAGIIS
jgi:hypothetical protein